MKSYLYQTFRPPGDTVYRRKLELFKKNGVVFLQSIAVVLSVDNIFKHVSVGGNDGQDHVVSIERKN